MLNCASDAGYFLKSSGSTSMPASDRARPSVTSKPSRASATAGSTRSFHGLLPCFCHARCRPATVPGTPTERWVLWWRSKSYLPSFIHIVGFAPAGAISRKSKVVAVPSAAR